MRRYQLGSHTKTDLKLHLVWVPKYRKGVLVGAVATGVRDILRRVALAQEVEIVIGKVARGHVHMFIVCRPTQNMSKLAQYFKGTSSRLLLSEFPHLRKQFWGCHFWARGYLAVSSGNMTDEVIHKYIADDHRFQIDPA